MDARSLPRCRYAVTRAARLLAAVAIVSLMYALAGGCAIRSTAKQEVTQAVEQWQWRQQQVGSPGDAPTTRQAISPSASDRSSPDDGSALKADAITPLAGYILQALQRNPSIQAAVAEAQARLERIPQVTALNDPMLRMIVRPEPIQTAAGDMYFTLGVGQKLPLPAKLDRAGRVALAEVRMAVEQLNATRLRVIADVERAYYRLYLSDRLIELTELNRQQLEDLEQVVDSQYRVGQAKQEDVLRVQTELANLRNDEDRYRRQRSSAQAALNQLMDYPPMRELPLTEPIEPCMLDGEVQELIALGEQYNPELAALAHQRQRDRERIRLAELAYWPDVDLGVEWTYTDPRGPFIPPVNPQTGMRPPINDKSDAGDDNWALTLQLNLPIWFQRIEAAKREARRRLEQTLHEQQATRNLIAFRIYDAWIRVQTNQDTIHLLDSTLIPQARQTYEVSLAGYRAGSADFLTVIDNWQVWLDFELMRHREIAAMETAVAELQREVGLQLIRNRVVSGSGSAGD